MSTALGLRERKKLKTRLALSEIAMELFARKGVDATTVEEICEQAEVSPSTFFRYFPTKEAAVFPAEERRIEVVEAELRSRPEGEPLHATIRRAVLALVDFDLENKKDFRGRLELMNREPAIAAYAMEVQRRSAERFTAIFADLLGVDPRTDLRPGLVVATAMAAVNSAWRAWACGEAGGDLRELIGCALDVLDEGLRAALAHQAGGGQP
jgi:AcrR family transcriptional regulator